MKVKKIRSLVMKDMILHVKAGKMRDRRIRRPQDARNKRLEEF